MHESHLHRPILYYSYSNLVDDQVTIVPTGAMFLEGEPRWKERRLKWEIMVWDSGQRARRGPGLQDLGWNIGYNRSSEVGRP